VGHMFRPLSNVWAFDLLLVAVKSHQQNPALLVIVAEIAWSAWLERNKKVFQGSSLRTPLQVIFCKCVTKLVALEATSNDNRHLDVLRESREYLQSCARVMSTITSVV
jgi:hypothetical protein